MTDYEGGIYGPKLFFLQVITAGNSAAGPSGYCECGRPAGDFFIVDVGFIVTWLRLGLGWG